MDNALGSFRQAWTSQLWASLRQGAGAHPASVSAMDVDSGWMLDEWERELLVRLVCQARGGSVRFVESSVGGGRSHFLYLLHERARRAGMATVSIPAEAQAEVWADPLALYQIVAAELLPSRPTTSPGLPALAACRSVELASAELFPELPAWGLALQLWGRERHPLACRYLLGQPLQADPSAGIHAPLGSRDAGLALRCLLRYLELSGETGLVAMADGDGAIEPSRERATLESLRNLIDRAAGGELPAMLMVFAVLPHFRQGVLPEYEALRQRLHNGFSHGPAGCLRPILILEEQRAWRAEQGVDFSRTLYANIHRLAVDMHPELARSPLTVHRNAELLLHELPWEPDTAGAARGISRTIARWFGQLALDSSEPESHERTLSRFLEAESL